MVSEKTDPNAHVKTLAYFGVASHFSNRLDWKDIDAQAGRRIPSSHRSRGRQRSQRVPPRPLGDVGPLLQDERGHHHHGGQESLTSSW